MATTVAAAKAAKKATAKKKAAAKQLVNEDLLKVLELARQSDSIELKLTIPESARRETMAALGADPLEAQLRQVYFFDTPDLALNKVGVVARARRIQGRDSDSVIKLRPVVPDDMDIDVRNSPNTVVELDAMPGGYVCSASVKGKLPPTIVRSTILEGGPLRKLFSKEQRSFFKAHAPDGLALDDLSVLGPIFVLKLKMMPEEFARRLVGEMWLYPDGSRIVELSTKCLPGEGIRVAGELQSFLKARGVAVDGDQQTKTKVALEFFSSELAASKS